MGDHPVVHFEITGRDDAALQRFYTGMFGWRIDTDNPHKYGMVDTGVPDTLAGGIGAAPDGGAGWVTVYVQVSNVPAALAQAEGLGGRRVGEVMDTGSSIIGMFADPEGHLIGVLAPKNTDTEKPGGDFD